MWESKTTKYLMILPNFNLNYISDDLTWNKYITN